MTARSRQIVGSPATGSPQIGTEIAAPLELRTPMGTVATVTNRVRMEARRQGRGSQSAEDSFKEMVENEGRDGLVGSAPGARMRRCLKLRQGASPLRPPAPFPSGSRFQNGRHQERVRKPRKSGAPLTDARHSEDWTGMRERGQLKADVCSRLPLVGPERHKRIVSPEP